MVEHSASRKRPPAAPATSGTGREAKGGGKKHGSDSDESDSTAPRVNLMKLEYQDRCCIRNLWHKCTETVENGGCRFGPHAKIAPEVVTQHALYKSMLTEHGTPDKPKPDKSKGKGKGKGKNNPAAPAVAGDEEEEPLQ